MDELINAQEQLMNVHVPVTPSGFLQIEDSLLHYLSDQWPAAYADLLSRACGEYPEVATEPGYTWLEASLLEHLKDQWPSADQAMMSRSLKEPAIMTGAMSSPATVQFKTAHIHGKVLDWVVLNALYPDATLDTFLNNWDNRDSNFTHFHLSTSRTHLYYLLDKCKISLVQVNEGWLASDSVTSGFRDANGQDCHVMYEGPNACFASDPQVAVCWCIAHKFHGSVVTVPAKLVGL
jgi:hypothetical protein